MASRRRLASALAAMIVMVLAVTPAVGASSTTADEAVPSYAMDFSSAPSLDPIEDQSIAEGQQMRVTATATDPDLPNDVLRFSLVAGPSRAAISPGGTVTWTPTEADGPGTHTFTVRVEDASGGSARESFSVNVTEVNSAPEIGLIPDQAVAPGDILDVQVAVNDPDIPANQLLYSASGLPAGVTIDNSTGVISGTIPATAASTSGVATVTVTDDGSPAASDSRSFTWQITLGNRSPVLEPIGSVSVDADGVVRFTATATDADGDEDLSFWLTEGIDEVPAGAQIDESTGEFTWQPADEQYGATYRFNVGVSDSGSPRLSDTQLVTITLPAFNLPPQVDEIPDMVSAEGDSVQFPVNVAEPDGDGVEFSAVGLPPGVEIDADSGFISGELAFHAATDSPYLVTVTVTDDGSPAAATSVSFTWEVTETNQPPVMEPKSVIVVLNTPTQIVLEATDPDGDSIIYGIATNPGFGTLAGSPPNLIYTATSGTADEFTVSASDGELTTESIVMIEIRESNEPPVAGVDEYFVPVDGRLEEPAPGVLGNDSDPDGNPIIAVLVAAPDHGQLSLNEDGSFTYAPEPAFSGTDKFTYAAVDDMGERMSATVVLTVADSETAVAPSTDAASGFRSAVIGATSTSWQQPETNGGVLPRLRRAIGTAVSSGFSSIPKLAAPLLLMLGALALALTVGKVSLLPAGNGKSQGEGVVVEYDRRRGFGFVAPDDNGEPVYVHAAAIEEGTALGAGRRVEFIAADIKGRRVATNVWPT